MSSNYTPPGYGPAPIATPTGKKAKKEKSPTKRSSSTLRWLFIAFGAIAGLLVILALTKGTGSSTYVVRTTSELPAMGVIADTSLEAVALPAAAIEPDTFTGASAQEALTAATTFIAGKWLSYPAGAGAQLRQGDFSAFGDLAQPLAPDERLLSITAKAANSVAGGVRAGDRIDLYAATGSDGLTGLLGANIEVVAVSILPEQFDSAAASQLNDPTKTLQDIVPPEPIPGTYVLRVRAADVARFVAADVSGIIYIALRSPTGVDALGQAPVTVAEALCTEVSTDPTCGVLSVPVSPSAEPSASAAVPGTDGTTPGTVEPTAAPTPGTATTTPVVPQ